MLQVWHGCRMRANESVEDMLTTSQAARVLGVHPATLRGYEADGLIVARRLPGGYRRWRRGDLLALRDGQGREQS